VNRKNGLVIAIDGPSGAGKSTLARLLAERLNYVYIDTGAMYRAVAWKAAREGVAPADEAGLVGLCGRIGISLVREGGELKTLVDGRDVTGEIRTQEMGMAASAVSKSPAVRARLSAVQRELGRDGGVVMDGRDIGTVVFPDADIKFFLDADAGERGRRRCLELREKGAEVDQERITSELIERDRQDGGRALAPLTKADDALLMDSTGLGIDEVLRKMLSVVEKAGR
jgi:CMP/dCMP kinase